MKFYFFCIILFLSVCFNRVVDVSVKNFFVWGLGFDSRVILLVRYFFI